MVQAVKDIFAQFGRVKEKGSFAQNISIVFSGNVLNLILQLLFAPIISRIYGPEAYGEYAYYNLIVTNIGFFAAMSLPSVYVLPKTRYEFLALGKIVFFGVLVLTGISLLVFLFFNGTLIHFKGSWLAIPAMILLLVFTNVNGILGSWNMREKRFKQNASVGVASNFLAKGSTLAVGYFWMPFGVGLLVGDLVKAVSTFFTQTSWKLRLVVFRFLLKNNWKEIFTVFKKNINVPRFIFPAQLMGKWSTDLYILIIGIYFSQETLGHYIFAVSLLNIPATLFENSIRPVIFQKAVETSHQDKKLVGDLLIRSLKVTLGVSVLPASILAVFSPVIFPFVFGDGWAYSGQIVAILSVQYIMQAVMRPYIDFWRVIKKERNLFYVNTVNIAFKALPLVLIFYHIEFEVFLMAFAICSAIGSLWVLATLLLHFTEWKYVLVKMCYLLLLLGFTYFVILSLSSSLANIY